MPVLSMGYLVFTNGDVQDMLLLGGESGRGGIFHQVAMLYFRGEWEKDFVF